jgi:hypothetical protein
MCSRLPRREKLVLITTFNTGHGHLILRCYGFGYIWLLLFYVAAGIP